MERQALAKVQNSRHRVKKHQPKSAPSATAAHPLNDLQQSIGSQAVQRLINSQFIQTKLQISKPGDPFEQEADRMAETVMRMTKPEETEENETSLPAKPLATGISRLAEHAGQPPPEEKKETVVATAPLLQRSRVAVREDDDEETVAPKLDSSVTPVKVEGIQSTSSPDLPVQRKRGEDKENEVAQTAPLIQRRTEEEEEEAVQRKLISGQPARTPSQGFNRATAGVIYRLCTECEEEKEGPSGPMVHRAAASEYEAEDYQVQTKTAQSAVPKPTSSLAANIYALNNGGSPLPETTRAFFEPRFGVDFSQVRVHTDARAAGTAKSINAKAFTVGRSVAFGAGQYAPESAAGQRLLAHELTHVVQQGGKQIQRAPTRAKNRAATNATPWGRQKGPLHFLSISIQRQDTPPDHLATLTEMLGRTDVPEEEVLSLLGQLTAPEKATVATDPSYKNGMASAFNTGEMVRAVGMLPLSLDKRLEWVGAATSTSSIDYSEIRSLITGATQADRDTLKTNTWRDFFVGVCDNSTIITAVTDLQFDLVTQLQWIQEEASASSLDYSQIQPLIVAAAQPDRDLLKTTAWRDFFVGVCDNSTIITAVTDLHFDLLTQLQWIQEEASASNLKYSQIQPFIVAATQPDRDLLKTTAWRDFFVGVCTNPTIMNALDDLNFDFLTTIQWLLEETSPSNVDFTWLCNEFKTVNVFPPREDTIACAIMERDIRDGNFDAAPEHRPPGWITRAHNQLLVADEMGGMVGETAKWRPSGRGGTTTFAVWASALAEGPVPSLGAMTVINCWEMIMLAAFRSGVMTWATIHSIYISGAPDWGAFLVDRLSFNSRISYDPGSPAERPVTGDIVFFDGSNHVALAVGSVDGLGRTQIYSFWPPPNTAFTAGGTIDDVKITTIEELNDYWIGRGHPAFTIEFATPNW